MCTRIVLFKKALVLHRFKYSRYAATHISSPSYLGDRCLLCPEGDVLLQHIKHGRHLCVHGAGCKDRREFYGAARRIIVRRLRSILGFGRDRGIRGKHRKHRNRGRLRGVIIGFSEVLRRYPALHDLLLFQRCRRRSWDDQGRRRGKRGRRRRDCCAINKVYK